MKVGVFSTSADGAGRFIPYAKNYEDIEIVGLEGIPSLTTLEYLYETCDVILYHTVYNEVNHHMVNDAAIGRMKDGAILVNVSRGGIFDAEAVLRGIESGKLGGVCLDVIEQESRLRTQDFFEECPLPVLGKLLKHKNVIFTSHTAFRTDEAVRNLTEGTMENLNSYRVNGTCKNELT